MRLSLILRKGRYMINMVKKELRGNRLDKMQGAITLTQMISLINSLEVADKDSSKEDIISSTLSSILEGTKVMEDILISINSNK
jgi:hypothetical protein